MACSASPMADNRLMHAMIRVPSVERAVAFWEERGAKRLSEPGKGSCFVGYGEYRDATFFALELSPAKEAEVVNTALSYIGLSMLPEGSRLPSDETSQGEEQPAADEITPASRFAAFMEDRQRRMPPAGSIDGIEVCALVLSGVCVRIQQPFMQPGRNAGSACISKFRRVLSGRCTCNRCGAWHQRPGIRSHGLRLAWRTRK